MRQAGAQDGRHHVEPVPEAALGGEAVADQFMGFMDLHTADGVKDRMKTARARLSVGRAVETEYKAEMCKKNKISMPHHTSASVRPGDKSVTDTAICSCAVSRRGSTWETRSGREWLPVIRVKVGSFHGRRHPSTRSGRSTTCTFLQAGRSPPRVYSI